MGDNTTTNTSFKIGDTTMTNITSNVDMKLQSGRLHRGPAARFRRT